VSEGANKNLTARDTLVQPFSPVHRPREPQCTNAQRYRQMDRLTDDMMMPIADHTVY